MREYKKNITNRLNHNEDEFFIAQERLKNVNFPFNYVYSSKSLPRQGWKIHLSPFIKDFDLVFKVVTKVCGERKVSYKHVYSYRSYFSLTNKNTPPSQFGKIITIYPPTTEEFIYLLKEFYKYIGNLNGLEIPTDIKFNHSNIIYARYGGINPNIFLNNQNDLYYELVDGNGNVYKEKREPFFKMPENISIPKELITANNNNKFKFMGYNTHCEVIFKNIIRRLATGNVFIGLFNGKKVVIKEAKKGSIPTLKVPEGVGKILKTNEMNVLRNKNIRKKINLPEFLDYFYFEDNLFIIESYIQGKTLKEISNSFCFCKPNASAKEAVEDSKKMCKIINNLKQIVSNLHSVGLIMSDISPDNFMIDEEFNVTVIDSESITFPGSKVSEITTPMFNILIDENMSDYDKDFYRLGMTFFWVLTHKNMEVRINKNLINFELSMMSLKFDCFNAIRLQILQLLNIKNCDLYILDSKSILEKASSTLNIIEDTLKEKQMNREIINEEFTSYVDNTISMSYGITGIIFVLTLNKIITTKEDKNYWSNFILKRYKKEKTSIGLLFGKAGIALTLALLDIDFEQNFPLMDLIGDLNKKQYDKDDLSFANGLLGILLALDKISHLNRYPNFYKFISKIIIREQLTKRVLFFNSGLEYGLSGALFCLIKLKKYKKFFDDSYFYHMKNEFENMFKDNCNDDCFLGIQNSQNENIMYPNLMIGGSGLIIVKSSLEKIKYYDLEKIGRFFNTPIMTNNGLYYGVCGYIYAITNLLDNQNVDAKNRIYLLEKLYYWLNYLLIRFQDNDHIVGFLSDQGRNPSLDLGSGLTGIYMALKRAVNVINKYDGR